MGQISRLVQPHRSVIGSLYYLYVNIFLRCLNACMMRIQSFVNSPPGDKVRDGIDRLRLTASILGLRKP